MPRKREPARLYLEPARQRGKSRTPATWHIRDFDAATGKPIKLSTGCSNDTAGRTKAEAVLEAYMTKKRLSEPKEKNRGSDEVMVSEVIDLYTEYRVDFKPGRGFKKPLARPKEVIARLEKLIEFFGKMNVDEVDIDSCEEFAEASATMEAGRRALQDLRAALNLAVKRKLIKHKVHVQLPDALDPRSEYLTRSEVAQLLWAIRKKRGLHFVNEQPINDYPIWKHLGRFLLVGIYTGTRKSRIYNASFEKMPGRPWIDTNRGEYHRLANREVAHKNKQAPQILIPPRLLNHMRRWESQGAKYLVEWDGKPADPSRAFRKMVREVLGRDDVVAHTTRHTAATWLMLDSKMPLLTISGYLGMSIETLTKVYGNHRLDEQASVGRSFSGGANRPTTLRKPEQSVNVPTASDRNNVKQRKST